MYCMKQATSNKISPGFVLTLLDAAALIEQRMDRALSNTRGVSFREFRLLQSLSQFHDQSAMRVELASAVGLTPSAITRALKPLEKLGYVTTEKSDRDARRSLAKLTKAGTKLLSDVQDVVDDVVAGLPQTAIGEQQLGDLRDGLATSKRR